MVSCESLERMYADMILIPENPPQIVVNQFLSEQIPKQKKTHDISYINDLFSIEILCP